MTNFIWITDFIFNLRYGRHPKPHIYLREGYWRVSPMPKPYWRYKTDFASAHLWANHQNQLRNNRNG